MRPAIGRVKTRSTKAAKPGMAGAKSWAISTRVPPAVGSIVQVTSMPRVAPAVCTKRSLRVAGSCQVRLRHVTGIPRPSTGTNGRRAMKSHTSAPSASARTTADRL